ncbi:MAG: hypothetical protein GXO87_03665 [Chlorobi bacterium]|nr:hypothetical protein [Chlorobiota bacterium]
MKFKKTSVEDRRKFFGRLSKGFLGLTIISLIPKGFWKSAEKSKSAIPVHIHEKAVKRINRK